MQAKDEALLSPPPEKGLFSRDELVALSPYRNAEVNADVVLYTGDLQIITLEGKIIVPGKIALRFLPEVAIYFGGEGTLPFQVPNEPVEVLCAFIGEWKSGFITDSSFEYVSSTGSFEGRFDGGLDFYHDGKGCHGQKDIHNVVFHLANMGEFVGQADHQEGAFFRRARFAFGHWEVQLGELQDADVRRKKIKQTRGNGITNVGYLSRVDGASFTSNEAKDALEFIYWFLAFVNSSQAGMLLMQGNNSSGEVVWEHWSPLVTKPYQDGSRWYPELLINDALSIASSCYEFWCDTNKRQWLVLAIALYCEGAHNNGGSEVELAKCCIVLEMLASVVLREENEVVTRSQFKKGAADRLRFLLEECMIPISIPPALKLLPFAVLSEGIPKDGPDAVFGIRNFITHLEPDNRRGLQQNSSDTLFQAWQLSLWYVELVMLYLFGYSGMYHNRIKEFGSRQPTLEKVPWVK